MTVAQRYSEQGGPQGMLASVVLDDGLIYEGVILDDRFSGLYLLIGGDLDRLSIFPWHTISRVVIKNNESPY